MHFSKFIELEIYRIELITIPETESEIDPDGLYTDCSIKWISLKIHGK
jgi:hypothetical protein